MHEAALARGVAKGLRERGLGPAQVRLAVRGGHHAAAEFESELKAHLAAEMPEAAPEIAALEVRRLPFGHLCPTCGVEFDSELVAPACPNCASDTIAEITDEVVEIEPLVPAR
jgi:Zn finger protein HypA/HybF involved in hydrogenase expression